jgi:ribosomal protein S18 acetylase RimI-like enzyme
MPILYRSARADDLEQAQELVVHSINDLTERHGFGAMATSRPPHFQLFSLEDDPDGLWVAEDAGQIVGFAFSWVSGGLWFLAELFVAPSHQGHGVGNELLKRTLNHAQKAGATNKALITFTFNTVSQGLYIRHGMFPRLPVYNLSVTREVLKSRVRGQQLRCVPLEDTASHLLDLDRIDARALGLSRKKHHRYLIKDGATKGFILYAGNDGVGYAYVGSNGHIGPLAVAERHAIGPAFETALNLATESGSSQVSAFIPGGSNAPLTIAVEHGMRITFPMVLVSTHDFGDWTQYLPRNPGFM